jgi:hypothetical protein
MASLFKAGRVGTRMASENAAPGNADWGAPPLMLCTNITD